MVALFTRGVILDVVSSIFHMANNASPLLEKKEAKIKRVKMRSNVFFGCNAYIDLVHFYLMASFSLLLCFP